MSDADQATPVSPEVMAELEQAVENAMKGARDPAAMDRAAERMDRMREEMRRRVGEVDLAVPLIREIRDGS